MEIWKKIDGFENYEVSNLGNVKSLNYLHTGKEQVLKAGKTKQGYLIVVLSKNGKRKVCLVHRLVWETFKGPIPEGMQCNHMDENPSNNRLDNLNLLTCKENINYGTRNERASKAKTNGKKSKPVLQYDLSGNVIKEYPSLMEVQRQMGYSTGYISLCCNGKYKQAYGFIWKYKKKVA